MPQSAEMIQQLSISQVEYVTKTALEVLCGLRQVYFRSMKSLFLRLGLYDKAKYKYRLHEVEWLNPNLRRISRPRIDRMKERRIKLIQHFGIDVIFDIGANTGQFAMEMRELGYKGRIVSFEPLQTAFAELARYAHYDSSWTAHNIAIGAYDGKVTINMSANSQSSSVLDVLPVLTQAAPQSAYVGQQEVDVRRIDSVLDDLLRTGEKLYLKIDTQGYEKRVIEGAKQSLPKIVGVQMETSLVALYAGETLFTDMIGYMAISGYLLMALEPEFSDPVTGRFASD